ncbi:MAG: hypothetical protein FD145_1621, partial [Candidatus Saganbacteria bacterium]
VVVFETALTFSCYFFCGQAKRSLPAGRQVRKKLINIIDGIYIIMII